MSPVIPTINCPTGNGEELPKKLTKNRKNYPKMAYFS